MMKVERAKQLLDEGGVIAVPTETVYGLAANAVNDIAVKRIFEIKERPLTNPLILHVSDEKQVKELVRNWSEEADILSSKFWPGPLTIVFEKEESVSSLISAGGDTVAVRVPDHPVLLALLKQLDYPLAAPSANKYQGISPTNAEHVKIALGDDFPVLDGGQCDRGIESTIVQIKDGGVRILRYGPITADMIVAAGVKIVDFSDDAVIVPGQAKRHYSPKTRLIYSKDPAKTAEQWEGKRIAFIRFYPEIESQLPLPKWIEKRIDLSGNNDFEQAARNLYDVLYQLDKDDYDLIIAEQVERKGLSIAIDDKLTRAQN